MVQIAQRTFVVLCVDAYCKCVCVCLHHTYYYFKSNLGICFYCHNPAYSSSMSDELPAATRTGASPSTALGMATAADSIRRLTINGQYTHNKFIQPVSGCILKISTLYKQSYIGK